MRRYLVIANQTVTGGPLLARLTTIAHQSQSEFHLLVPASPPANHVWTDAEAFAHAAKRLEAGLASYRAAGLAVSGEVGDAHPEDAVNDLLLRGERFDAIVLSTLPRHLSRWLKMDLPRRMVRFGLPVIHVMGVAEKVGVEGSP